MQRRIIMIAEHFGLEHQKLKTIEELKELIQAIENINSDFTVEKYESLVEEIADAENMIAQLKHYYEIPEKELNEIKQYKIDRTIKRNNIERGQWGQAT